MDYYKVYLEHYVKNTRENNTITADKKELYAVALAISDRENCKSPRSQNSFKDLMEI